MRRDFHAIARPGSSASKHDFRNAQSSESDARGAARTSAGTASRRRARRRVARRGRCNRDAVGRTRETRTGAAAARAACRCTSTADLGGRSPGHSRTIAMPRTGHRGAFEHEPDSFSFGRQVCAPSPGGHFFLRHAALPSATSCTGAMAPRATRPAGASHEMRRLQAVIRLLPRASRRDMCAKQRAMGPRCIYACAHGTKATISARRRCATDNEARQSDEKATKHAHANSEQHKPQRAEPGEQQCGPRHRATGSRAGVATRIVGHAAVFAGPRRRRFQRARHCLRRPDRCMRAPAGWAARELPIIPARSASRLPRSPPCQRRRRCTRQAVRRRPAPHVACARLDVRPSGASCVKLLMSTMSERARRRPRAARARGTAGDAIRRHAKTKRSCM